MKPATRHALVTGAASGIGCAVARLLAEQGWTVGMVDLDEGAVGRLASELGSNTMPLAADVTDPVSVANAFARFGQYVDGNLDLLVNCAGLLYTGHFEEQPASQIARLLAVNNLGLAHCCQSALPLLKSSAALGRQPAVVNLSSAASIIGIPSMATYSASKFWVRGFTEALASEWARYGVAVRDVLPPFVNTPMLETSRENLFVKRLGVNLSPQDVAQHVLAASASGPLHHAVSWRFKLLLALVRVVPPALVRAALAWVGGYRPRPGKL